MSNRTFIMAFVGHSFQAHRHTTDLTVYPGCPHTVFICSASFSLALVSFVFIKII